MSKPQIYYEASRNRRVGRLPFTKEENERKVNHLCVNCGTPTKMYAWKGWEGKKYKTFCSDECSHKWWTTHDWATLRLVFLFEHKDNLVCNECKKKIELSEFGIGFTWGLLQVDHIIPIWMGGAEFDKSNLQILCMECANKKNKKDQKDFKNYKMSLVAMCYLHCLFETNNLSPLEEYF